MKSLSRLCFLLVVLFTSSSLPAQSGAVFYVSKSGKNSNSRELHRALAYDSARR